LIRRERRLGHARGNTYMKLALANANADANVLSSHSQVHPSFQVFRHMLEKYVVLVVLMQELSECHSCAKWMHSVEEGCLHHVDVGSEPFMIFVLNASERHKIYRDRFLERRRGEGHGIWAKKFLEEKRASVQW